MYGLNGRGHAIRGRGIGARFSSPRNIQNSKNALSTLYCRHQVAGDSSLPSRKESVCSVEIRSREQPPTCLENLLNRLRKFHSPAVRSTFTIAINDSLVNLAYVRTDSHERCPRKSAMSCR